MHAKWITITERPNETSLYIFKKTFSYEKKAESFKIEISADSRYRLYINGKFMGDGPSMGGEMVKYYETIEAADALVCGENVIEVHVLHAVGNYFIAVNRENYPALFFNGILDGKYEIYSDKDFTCERVESIEFYHTREILRSVCPFEHIKGERVTRKLETAILYHPNYDSCFINSGGVSDLYMMEKRPTPMVIPGESKPLSVVREYTDENGLYNIILDAGAYTTSMLNCKLKAEKGSELKIYYAECMHIRDAEGKLTKAMRDDPMGEVPDIAYDTVTASGAEQVFEPFWYRTFRFIRVESAKKPELLSISHSRYVYEFEKHAKDGGVGYFETNDPIYTEMWKVSRNTIECSAHDIYVDCPYYEQQQYAMDGGLEALFSWRMSNDSGMQRQIITTMAHSQRPSGLVYSSYPSGHRQIIPSFSLYYVMMHREYLRHTGDTAFVRSYTGICDRILEAFENMLDENGLVMPPYGWCYLDWVKGWNHGSPEGGGSAPITVYSMLYAAALGRQAEVCDACGRRGLADEYRARREKMIRAINDNCYDSNEKMYIDVYGYHTLSYHTTVWAVLSGCVAGDEAVALMQRTMERDDVAKCSFSMNYYLLRALEKTGLYEKYAPSILEGWHTMLKNHCTTWCESIALPRSECHGWSSAPMYEMSAVLLGVYPTEDGFESVRIKPHTIGLPCAKGRVPTPYGYIDVEWKCENGKTELKAVSSREINMEIVLPSGKSIYVTADKAELAD